MPDELTSPALTNRPAFDRYELVAWAAIPPGWWFVENDGSRWQNIGAKPVLVRDDDPYRDLNIRDEIDHWEQHARAADGSCTKSTLCDSARKAMVWVEVPFPPVTP